MRTEDKVKFLLTCHVFGVQTAKGSQALLIYPERPNTTVVKNSRIFNKGERVGVALRKRDYCWK